uniref:F-box domain-containing protein n=1 Tax=Pyramimonas obovata TaxID=1411642 RepID=A0A7S0QTZ0_9CHLO|mmetsp:Transcript_14826/g.31843  ORF Transcript_14826/g.31843 Transcript_14826/m.31843 type:complete len:267 (+) Transcript_14826:186-986(+)
MRAEVERHNNNKTTHPMDVVRVELAKVLGDGRFKALLSQLREELSSSSRCTNTVLLAEVEERVGRLDDLMGCYNSGSGEGGGIGGALSSRTVCSQPSKMQRPAGSKGGALQPVHQSGWADLPAHLLTETLKQLGWPSKGSSAFRRVCKRWQGLHDETVSRLHIRRSFPWGEYLRKRFAGVRTLDLETDDTSLFRRLGSLSALTSLSFNPGSTVPVTFSELEFITDLTSLRKLSLAGCRGLHDAGDASALARMLAPLTNLTSLDLSS